MGFAGRLAEDLPPANARTDEERQKLPENLSLWPFTGRVVVLSMLNPKSGRGRVWYEKNDGRHEEKSSDGLFTFVGDTEPAFLAEFWTAITRFHRFVTFNGRGFDGPFLMLRSAALGIPVKKNLLGRRYALKPHTDLLEVLSFFGASRKWNLDFACKAFGDREPEGAGDGRLFGRTPLPDRPAARDRALLPTGRRGHGAPLHEARKDAPAGAREPETLNCLD